MPILEGGEGGKGSERPHDDAQKPPAVDEACTLKYVVVLLDLLRHVEVVLGLVAPRLVDLEQLVGDKVVVPAGAPTVSASLPEDEGHGDAPREDDGERDDARRLEEDAARGDGVRVQAAERVGADRVLLRLVDAVDGRQVEVRRRVVDRRVLGVGREGVVRDEGRKGEQERPGWRGERDVRTGGSPRLRG